MQKYDRLHLCCHTQVCSMEYCISFIGKPILLVAQSRMSQYQISIQSDLHLKYCRIAQVLTAPRSKDMTLSRGKTKTLLALLLALVPKGLKPSGATLHSCDPFMVVVIIVSRCYLHTKQM